MRPSPLRILTFCLLFASSLLAQDEDYTPKYHTIAHKIMAAEAPILGIKPNYKKLDELLDQAKKIIPTKDTYTPEEAKTILYTIDYLLKEHNFVYELKTFLIQGLEAQTLDEAFINQLFRLDVKVRAQCNPNEKYFCIDCDLFTILYLAIGEILDLPIKKVRAPNHSFIRWFTPDPKYNFNWETTGGGPTTEQKLRDSILEDPNVDPNFKFEAKDPIQVLARTHLLLAIHQSDNKNIKGAIISASKSLELDPSDLRTLYRRGLYYLDNEQFGLAITDLQDVYDRDKTDKNHKANLAVAYFNRGNYYFMLQEYAKALPDYKMSLIVGDDNEFYQTSHYNIAICLYYAGNYPEALKQMKLMLQVFPDHDSAKRWLVNIQSKLP